ncbi:MAG: DnaB-like helicase C-terminal domain-containing protein [Pyrinomonadaceae bacterium]|nr:DnaB-like helicase C-terminal domain-containing protein [Pyrinomonadaceae bacterium]
MQDRQQVPSPADTESDYTARQLLSTLWMLPEYIPLVTQVLTHDRLLEGSAEYVWQVIKNHVGNGKLDIPTALEAINRNGKARQFFQQAQEENYAPRKYSERQIVAWANKLAEKGLRRFGAGIAEKAKGSLGNTRIPLDEAIAEVMREFAALRSQGGVNTWRSSAEVAIGTRRMIEAVERGETGFGVGTGFPSVDVVLGGFKNGELTILAARPSMGKTAAACEVILHIATCYYESGSDECVGFFSAETSAELLQLRMACSMAKVNQSKMRAKKLTPEEKQRLDDAVDYIAKLPIYIDESSRPTTENMLLRCLALDNVFVNGERKKIGVVFFDFVELAGDVDANEVQRISKVALGLKVIAKYFKIPVVALSQVDRAAEGRMPTLVDLRWSGQLEQLSYAVIFLFRPSYYKKRKDASYDPHFDDERYLAIWMIAKNKDGPTGPVQMRFEEEFAKFSDPEVAQAADLDRW